MSNDLRRHVLIDAPSEAAILAARHLDATEGPVQVGSIVDTATRSAITTVLRYIAKAHSSPQAPDVGEIQVSRELGLGVRVDHAPPRALIGLHVIRDMAWPANVTGVVEPDLVNIADQVLYRVTGYDAASASLVVDLVEDWRPKSTATLSEAEAEGIKTRWREAHGKPGTAHPVTELREDTVCTPIPAATLMHMSEVPPELLVEQQRTRADNAEERLRLAREALACDGYFTAEEIGDDIAPRLVEWLTHHRDRTEEAEDQLRRTRIELEHWQTSIVPELRAERDQARNVLGRVRALEGRLWQVDDGQTWPVSTVCHSIANDLRVALDQPQTAPQSTGEPHTGLVVEPYRNDQHQDRWVFRCWGTDTCDGWLSLDHDSQQSAERARDRHVTEAHPEEQHTVADTPACTATIVEPHTGSPTPVPCALPVHGDDRQHESAPEGPTRRRLYWTDHHAGATPHKTSEGP